MIRSMTEDVDLARLRTRVAALEAENAELKRRSEAAIARERRQADRLDELGLDLNAVMKRRGAKEFRAAVRGVRWFYRQFRYDVPKRWRERRAMRRLLR